MFGPHEIEYEGRKYFSNVSLREHHIVEHDNALYLFDVDSNTAFSIPAQLAATMKKVDSAFGSLIPEAAMAELRKFKLVAGEEDVPSEAVVDSEAAVSGGECDYPVVNIALFLVQECNMRCVYCYGDGGQYAGKGMMTEETAFRAVDWLMVNSKRAERVRIGFFGGEPLLNFSLMKRIVPYAQEQATTKGKQVVFSITTNGSLLNDEIIRFLKTEKIETFISFDGPPEYQNRQRPFKDGKGSYDKVFANVQKLLAALPHLTVRATVCGDADPLRIKEAMEQSGFTTYCIVKASPVLLNTQPGVMPAEGEQALQRMLAFNDKAAEELLAAIRERKISKDCLPGLLPVLAEMDSGRKRHYGCGIAKGMVGISVNGHIYPCHRFVGLKKLRMGNIADYHVEGLNEYWSAVVDHLPECRSCWARYLCGGGCFYNNKAHTGSMHRPESLFCRERKAMFEGLIHVFCDLSKDDREFLRDITKSGPQEKSTVLEAEPSSDSELINREIRRSA
jgi:uncharacterized protein